MNMAIAKKCDRCGQLYEPYSVWNGGGSSVDMAGKPNSIVFARLNANGSQYCAAEYKKLQRSKFITRDLCNECMDKLLEWWSSGGEPR